MPAEEFVFAGSLKRIPERQLGPRETLRLVMVGLFDTLAKLAIRTPAGCQKKVAVLRLDAIGDFLVWQTYAGGLRQRYPDHEIVLLCNPIYTDLAAASSHWDRVIEVKADVIRRRFAPRWTQHKRLRQEGFAVILNPVFSRTIQMDLIVRAVGAKKRIGMAGDCSNIPLRIKRVSDAWYTELVESPGRWQPEWNRSRDFFSYLLGRPEPWREPRLGLATGVEQDTSARPSILPFHGPYAVLFPGASSADRRWPPSRFAEIGRWLAEERGWRIVVAGGPEDALIGERIGKAIGDRAFNAAGKTTVAELAALLGSAEVVVSNETSAVHIAAAVRTPAVAILGGGHFGRFMPYPGDKGLPLAAFTPMECFQCNWNCIYHPPAGEPAPCVAAVEVQMVQKRVLSAISAS